MVRRKVFGLVVALGLLLSAGLVIPASQVAAQETFPVNIVFLNAMTAQKEIDVYINGDDSEQRVVEGLTYGEFSEPFEGTAPATGVVVKQNVNIGFDRWLFNTVVPTQAGQTYVVVISDFVLIPTLVDTTDTARVGARATLVHAASQAPPIDITIDGNLVTQDLRYGNATDAGEIVAGAYDVQLLATGTTTVAVDVPGAQFEAGQVYVYAVIGEPGSTEEPLTVVVFSGTAGTDAEATPEA